MQTRMLRELEVSAVGYGCMGFSHGYGPSCSEREAISLMRSAIDLGCNFFDTAEGYLHGQNEILVGKALAPCRERCVLATKLHLSAEEGSAPGLLKEEVRRHLIASLKRLNTDYVDLYYYHRINPALSLAEVAEAMGALIKEGLIRGWGVSQADCDQIKLANSVTPLSAVQNEYSMVERMYTKEMELCNELGIGFVPFSPMGAGFLSGIFKPGNTYVGDDVRRAITRYKPENIERNAPIIELLQETADKLHVSKAQLALAWILAKGPHNVPIPGMRRLERVKENLGAAEIELTAAELKAFDEALNSLTVYGNRTDEDIMAMYAEGDEAKPGENKPE